MNKNITTLKVYNLENAIHFDAAHEAFKILHEHTAAYISGVHAEFDSNGDMFEAVNSECAFILTQYFVEGKYTPMQYNAVRNELASLLWKLFGNAIEAEDMAELNIRIVP